MARQLDNWLRSYLLYTSFNEAPDIFHFWAGVGTIAGALRRKVYIDQEYFMWTPNCYIIFCGPPGIVQKSTSMGQGVGLLRELDSVKFGPNALTWQALVQSLERASEMILMNDGTFHPMSCLTFASSELGSLLDPQDRKMVDILVEFWDGQTTIWEKETKTAGSNRIPNPWVNIMACTTPTWLADNLPRTMIGGGFTSRCIFVYAERKRRLVPYPKGVIPAEVKALKPALIHDLEVISTLKGEYEMTPEALDYGRKWYEAHYEHPPTALAHNPQFEGYLARKQGHVHKLAMILAASERDELLVTKAELEQAVEIVNAAEKDLPKVFKAINTSEVMETAQRLVGSVRAHGKISKEQLYAMFFHVMPVKDFNDALDSAVQAGLLQIGQDRTTNEVYIIAREKHAGHPGTDRTSAFGLENPLPAWFGSSRGS